MRSTLTEAELDRLRSLCRRATPGPWLPGDTMVHTNAYNIADCMPYGPSNRDNANVKANARFIAAARAALPELLDERERMKQHTEYECPKCGDCGFWDRIFP